jgi:ATP-dependent Clp protease adapter protein ClpS
MSEQVISKPATQTQVDTAKPWVVIFHNDNSTTFDCVVEILMFIIGKSNRDAYQLAVKIHNEGQAVVAQSTQEIAETLKNESIHHARLRGCPLKVTAERNN